MTSELDFPNFKRGLLEGINLIREKYGAPALEYREPMQQETDKKAQIVLKNDSVATLPDPRSTNDIVYIISTNMEITPKIILDDITKRQGSYNFDEGNYTEEAASFTQAVWVNSADVCFGYAVQGENNAIVLRYHPPGNIKGCFLKNVLKKDTPVATRTKDDLVSLESIPSKEEIKDYFLKAHNQIREKYGAPKLVWSDELVTLAEEVAKENLEAFLEKKDAPRRTEDVGVNVVYSTDGIVSPKDVMALWYSTKRHLDYTTYNMTAENATIVQILLFATSKIGVAYYTKDNICFCVAAYSPKGVVTENIKSEIPKPLTDSELLFADF